MDKQKLENYARLLVEVGSNVQKGQALAIISPVALADFARVCARAAYDAGASEVNVCWKDDELSRLQYLRADPRVFDGIHAWASGFYNEIAEKGEALLTLYASDPESLKGVEPDRLQRMQKAWGKATEPFRHGELGGAFQWCIGSAPIPAWTEKVFPGDPQGGEKLWDAILAAVRVDGEGDPVARWREHIALLASRRAALDRAQFVSLHYRNSLGTDLTVGLPERHIWQGGSEKTLSGVEFVANMPTEEIFSAPHRERVEGVVYASRPLVLNGNVIRDFGMELHAGKITRVWAAQGREILENAIRVDEGACRLGECALVPWDSPISRSGVLFYNTLFDENASCHFAFGAAYPCLENGLDMTPEELTARGLNNSVTHVDFMVGTPDLSIVGRTHDGREIPVFVNGTFARFS